jgi:hypothetical protein
LRFASLLIVGPRGTVERATILRPHAPECKGDDVRWSAPRLGVDGAWDLSASNDRRPVERTLFRNEHGAVRWHCLSPNAHGTVHVDGRTITGAGYVERLTLEVEPWNLGLRELRWGRANDGNKSVTWIDWVGTNPLRVVLVDGEDRVATHVDDQRVAWRGGELALGERQTLREGTLANGPLRAVAPILRGAPASMLQAHETRWVTHAMRRDDDDAPEDARELVAVHAVVRYAAPSA